MVIGEDGIVESVCEQNVFGTIKDLAVIPRSKVSIIHLETEEFILVIRSFTCAKIFFYFFFKYCR